MPRFKQIPKIQQLMGLKKQIRNIGIIAHIDHGKTTLADSLLAGAGLLPQQMAGVARVLDYLEEEQKRKITIKTANITLLFDFAGHPCIINLIDTPGHVDFTGKVTRALRVIDGVVVVVDAVEEIMAQTEILIQQALTERVQPVLFINKVDRLIRELQLSEEQIQKKLNQIISKFNDQIELYAEDPFKNQWKIDFTKGNIALGSALDGWGFTLQMIKQQAIKFFDVIAAYKNRDLTQLKNKLPVNKSIIEMIVNALPDPQKAQSYRIEKIWDGDIRSYVGKALVNCSDDSPSIMYVTSIQVDLKGDILATGRLFSGKIRKGDTLHLLEASTETTVNNVFLDMGAMREEVPEVTAGALATLILSSKVQSGETIIDSTCKDQMVPFERIRYVSEPVVTLAVEPKNPQDISNLKEQLDKLILEDPNLQATIDKDTGEFLLSGMGELHLEIAINRLKSSGVNLTVSQPRVVYMECVQKKGIIAETKTSNSERSVWVQVEPNLIKQQNVLKDEKHGAVLSVDEHQNMLLDSAGKTNDLSADVLQSVIDGFQFACRAGPLCGEPIRDLKVNLVDLKLDENPDKSEVMRGIGKAVFGSFLTANPTLLEPIYRIIISVTSDLANQSSRILTSNRGKVTLFEQKGHLTQLSGYIPVAETFGFSAEMRSATSGRAIWQLLFDHWEKLPQKSTTEVISKLRKHRGLALEIPKPEKFLE
ncbi:MAG: GTP-binding protein [Candidatus Bathyarchaeota archaeon]|nr:GTP-binding protein [Candidatus Bathyarchaeota archaeon]